MSELTPMKIHENMHSKEDWSKLMGKLCVRGINKSQRLRKIHDDKNCAKGNHGYNIIHAGFGGGYILWKCENCGASWSETDWPMTI